MNLDIPIINQADQNIERLGISIEMEAEVVIGKIDIIVVTVHRIIMQILQAKKDQDMNILVKVIIMVQNHSKGERLKIRHNQADTIAQKNLIM